MKKIILTLMSLTIIQAVAKDKGANGCNLRHVETDKYLESRCQLETKEGAVEFVKLKKYCQRIEGAEISDCYIARTCPLDGAGIYYQAPIMLVSSMKKKNVYCHKSGKDYVLLRDEKAGIEVISRCKENQPDKIILKVNKTEKICDL